MENENITFNGNINEYVDQLIEIYLSLNKENRNILNKNKYNSIKIHNLDSLKIKPNNNCENNCVICLDKFIKSDEINILDCKHYYHMKCLKIWLLEYNNSCPICRELIN